MSNIEKIRQEIERLKNIAENDNASEYLRGQARVCRIILSFIDSLPEEKPSEDLEEAAEKYAYKGIPEELKSEVKPIADEIIKNFMAGAEWGAKHLK